MTQGTVMEDVKKAIGKEDVTRIVGEPTRGQVKELQEELAAICAKYSTDLFEGGDDYGHMCMVINDETYGDIINNNMFTYTPPRKPEAFDGTLTNQASEVTRMKRVAEHKRKIEEFEKYRGVLQGIRERILYAVDEQYLRALKQTLIGYAKTTPREMLDHLFDNCTMGTLDIDQLEKELDANWETDDHINEYIRKLEERRKHLKEAGIEVTDSQILLKFVKQMYLSGHFDENDMTDWEKKTTNQKTVEEAKRYFKKKYKEKMMYRKATARQMGYTNNVREARYENTLQGTIDKIAEAAQEDRKYVNQAVASNKQMMETMMATIIEQQKQMTALMTKMNTAGGNGKSKNTSEDDVVEKCPKCGRKAHKGGVDACWSDPKNADKAPEWYKKMIAKRKAKEEAETNNNA